MWLPSVITTEPASQAVSTEELKRFLRVDGTDDDAEIAALCLSAVRRVETYTGLGLVSQTRLLQASSWDDLEALPVGPVQSIASLSYLDAQGILQTLSAGAYELASSGIWAEIRPQGRWPGLRGVSNAVRVSAIVGFGDPIEVPDDLKMAVKFLVAQWYDQRMGVADREYFEIPNTVSALLSDYRRF